ncbi:DUF1834 family protein [Erwinia psidii]|uniref:phage protein Gp37 n=1 Tax=Erwinia psidii TaxID=69224 RepID=UPI00226B9EFE|nr:phage protein Gp37 [Erwinia psidii]MCX8957223.1 DUF1834 family protein [Erwinia psidii]
MITSIEKALCERLQTGLGRMVNNPVVTWNVLATDIGVALRQLPGVCVVFLGITNSRAHDTSRQRFLVTGRFSVFVVDYNLRSNEALRHGGPGVEEPGCYRMIRCVRRLLTGQDLGLKINYLNPEGVRPVAGQSFNDKGVAVYECVFTTQWIENALESGHWPAPETPEDEDADFVRWGGHTEKPSPWHESTHMAYVWPGESAPMAEDIMQNRTDDDD